MIGMLDSLKVLDFTFNIAGPMASAELADYGASVVKIEKMTGAEERNFAPMVKGKSLCHSWINRGKKSITLNLKDDKGLALAKQLIQNADVMIESFRPGVMKGLGLGYDDVKALNPSIIYCSVSAYGQTGKYSTKPGYDIIAQAVSGMMSVTGNQEGSPMKHGTALADFFAGVGAYASIMTALFYRERTGKGQHVDMSLVNGMIHLNSTIDRLNEGLVAGRTGNHMNGLAPFGLFNGNKGESLIIAAPSNKMFSILANAMKQPSLIADERFNTVQKRAGNYLALVSIIETWLKTFTNIQEAVELLEASGIACSKVYDNQDVANDAHFREQGWIVDAHPAKDVAIDTFVTRGPLAKFSEAPGHIRQASVLGEHNYEIFKEFGLSESDIDDLLSSWRD